MKGRTVLHVSLLHISFPYFPIMIFDDIDARSQMRQSVSVDVEYHLSFLSCCWRQDGRWFHIINDMNESVPMSSGGVILQIP